MSNRTHLRTSVVALLFAVAIGAASALAVMAFTAAGVSVPPGFVDEGIVSGLTKPTGFAFAPDGRIFIIEEPGDFKVFQANGSLLAKTHIDVNFPTAAYTERGLLGIALDPNFAGNQFVYVYYTRIPPGQPATSPDPTVNRLSRFTMSGNQVQTASELVLLDNKPAPAPIHHGGDVHFGADGKIWVSTGDGNDPTSAPVTTSLNGKLLRINPDGSAPSDNPFYNGSGQPNDFVWAKGFRNPWRFTFHPTTHAPFIADVGWDTWEELDIGYKGADYGWPAYEGPAVNQGPASYVFTAPITTYNHSTNCEVIMGGDFVYGAQWPSDYQNNYFYSDLGCGKLWRMVLDPTNPYTYTAITEWATGLDDPVAIKRGLDGFLYYVKFSAGELRRIRWANTFPNRVYLPLIRRCPC